MTYEHAVGVVVGVTADGALAAAGPDAEVAQVVGVVLVVDGQTEAQLTAALLHHLREGLASLPVSVVFLELQLLDLDHPLDYVLLSFSPAALPVVEIL